jgi:hypothetical protein
MKDFLLFVRHPYAAGIIGIIWIGSTIMFAIQPALPVVTIVTVNMVASFIIAAIGFRSGR